MDLKKNMFAGEGYSYLSKEDSNLYDSVKDSEDLKDQKIKQLILDKAKACRSAHCSSRY